MAEASSPASEAANSGPSASFPLFIDTNLDTHLAMLVSAQDTVADLKTKVMVEHPLCFPNVGQITIHALKVRRKSCFYHLSDAMLLRRAFEGTKRTWFVHVDAASTSLTEAQGGAGESFLRSENVEQLKKSHVSPLEPGATDLPDDPAVRSQSHAVNVPADENLVQPDLRSPLVNDGQKSPSFDHPFMMLSFNDDSKSPEVASSHADNPQILSICQGSDVSKGSKLRAKDSGAELGKNLANDANDVLETHSPSKHDTVIGQRSNVGDEECGVDRDKDRPASFVAINKDKSKKRDRSLLLDNNLGGSSRFAAKKKHRKEKDQDAIVEPENLSKEDDVRTGADFSETPKLENKLKKSASEDEKRTKNGTSLAITSKPLDDDCSSPNQLVNGKREKKRKPSSSHNEVESEELSKINERNKGQSGDRSKPEVKSFNASGNTYGSPDEVIKKNAKGSAKESNPTIAGKETTQDVTVRNPSNLSEKDKHSAPLEPMLESTVTETAICFTMGVGANVNSQGKVDCKIDDLEQATAPASKKAKKLKKHRMVSEKATAETLDKEGDHIPGAVTTSQNEIVNLDKVKGKIDDLEQAAAPASKKAKRLKKHHMVSEKATAETLDKEGDHIPGAVTTSQNESVNLDKVEGKIDDLEQATAPVSEKSKKLKHRMVSEKATAETLDKEGDLIPWAVTTSQNESVNLDKVEGKIDDLEQAAAPVSKKSKKLKHCMVSEKATAETLDNEGYHIPGAVTTSQNESANLGVNVTHFDKSNLASLNMTHAMCESLEDNTANVSNDGIKENEINGSLEEGNGVVSVQAVSSENKKAKKRKKHLVDEPENLASLNAPQATCKSLENICVIAGIHLPEESGKEDGTLPKSKEPKAVSLEAQNFRDHVDASKVPGPNEATETIDFGDRKGKKPKKSRAGASKTTHALQSGREYFKNAGEVNHQMGSENRWDDNDDGASLNSKHHIVESIEVETVSSQTKMLQVGKAGQADNASGDEVCPKSAPISRTEEAADCTEEKRKRKSKKNLLEQQDGEHVTLDLCVCQNDENKKDNASSRKKNKQKLDKTSSKNQLTESLLGGGYRVKTEASKPRRSSKTAASQQIPSDKLEFEVKTRPTKTDARESEYHVNDSQHNDSDLSINFLKHFVPGGDELVVTAQKLAAEETQVRKSLERTTEQAKEPNLQSQDTTFHLNSPTSSQNHQRHKKKPRDSTLDGSAYKGPLLKAEKNRNVNHHGKAAAVISDTSADHQHNNSIAVLDGKKETSKSKREDGFGNRASLPSSTAAPEVTANASKKKANASQATSSASTASSEEPIYISKQGKQKSRLSQYRVVVSKVPDKNSGELLNNFDRERNMFAASDSIFKNMSGESSEDEVNESDATIDSFSDHSSASSYSDGDHKGTPSNTPVLGRKANMVSPGAERVSSFANGEKNTEKVGDGITLSRSIDVLLRTSRSYKKAKRNASQSVLEDNESQPVDTVPDSQAAPDFPEVRLSQ